MISTRLKRFYDPTFTISDAYKSSLPDMQNGPASLIEGANVPIQQVGISNFRLPLKYAKRNGDVLTLETSVDGFVSLDADIKGINMSRIIRTFYEFKDEAITQNVLEYILKAYKKNLKSRESYIRLQVNYPLMQESLRSDLRGYQYYSLSLEAHLNSQDEIRNYMHLDFDYSSACPCSYELAEHARETREIAAISHSQRSLASVTVQYDREFHPESLIELMRKALTTETQVMVKREDEQAFAELNGAYQKFVEDATRLVFDHLDQKEEIRDFLVRCTHFESLHSHDAVSRICKGIPGGLR